MAGRGRGRGRGGGANVNAEQVGLTKDALPPPCLQPPPKYPTLEYKTPPFESSTEISYLFELKRDFAETMLESWFHVRSEVIKKDIERYSVSVATTLEPAKVSWHERCDWTMLPVELKPLMKRKAKKKSGGSGAKVARIVNIEETLEKLAEKETLGSDVEEDAKAADEEEKDDEEDVVEEEINEDEEMDEGTDYGNNYFDNGEGYDDEDDNLDDDPVF